jgi:hypothetical protein
MKKAIFAVQNMVIIEKKPQEKRKSLVAFLLWYFYMVNFLKIDHRMDFTFVKVLKKREKCLAVFTEFCESTLQQNVSVL